MSECWVDGCFVAATEVGRLEGPAPGPREPGARAVGSRALGVFETVGAVGGALPLWDLHLARLRGAAERLGLACEPPPDLLAAARELLVRNGHVADILRVTLHPCPRFGADGQSSSRAPTTSDAPTASDAPTGPISLDAPIAMDASPTWCLTSRGRRRGPGPVLLHPVQFTRPPGDLTAGLKCTDRSLYDAARMKAHAQPARLEHGNEELVRGARVGGAP